MKLLTKIYWLKFALGIIAAFICTGFGIATGTISRQTESYTKVLNGLSLAIITYLISYYITKLKFMPQLEKRSKLFTTGIGIYFLTWIVFWILLYTLVGA